MDRPPEFPPEAYERADALVARMRERWGEIPTAMFLEDWEADCAARGWHSPITCASLARSSRGNETER